MEPLDPPSGAALPPPVVGAGGSSSAPVGAMASPAVPLGQVQPLFAEPSSPATPGHHPTKPVVPPRLSMFVWRVIAAAATAVMFVLAGSQVQRVVDDRPRSTVAMWSMMAAGLAAAITVLVWTWVATENARRLLAPARGRELPNPWRAVSAWALPYAFVVTASLGTFVLERNMDASRDTVSSIPLAVAVLSLLVAIPLTYRPMFYLANVVRQVGGYSPRLVRWMWVPVVLAVVGVVSVVLLRVFGAVDEAAGEIAPLWVVAVVAIAPCVIVMLLAWRAAESVEEAIDLAYARRRGWHPAPGTSPDGARRRGTPSSAAVASRSSIDVRQRVRQVPGSDILRLCVVTLLAGLALLSVIGAVVMFLFWDESRDGVLLASQSDRAWDALSTLHSTERIVAFALIGLVSSWTFVAVLNARLASGRRRNPLIAALSWPVAGAGLWMIADRLIVDQSVGSVMIGFVAQAAVLFVPFLLLERTAEAVGARRTPLRITYTFGVVLLVHIQGLGGLSNLSDHSPTTQYGHLAGYLALGALVQLVSTLAVTDACQAITDASAREAEQHNFLAAQRSSADPTMVTPGWHAPSSVVGT